MTLCWAANAIAHGQTKYLGLQLPVQMPSIGQTEYLAMHAMSGCQLHGGALSNTCIAGASGFAAYANNDTQRDVQNLLKASS